MIVQAPNAKLHVVLGTGPVGQTIIEQLAASGVAVRVVARSTSSPALPQSVEYMPADLCEPEEVKRVIDGASVVYHCAAPAYTQWTTTFPKMNSAIISALACSNARLVALDNLYAYGRSGTLHEQLPYAAEGPKGKLRAQLADQFMDAHKREGLQLTIARSSDFLGPKVRVSAVGERFWPQLLRGKSVSWFGQLGVPHTYTYVPDLARAMIRLGEEEAAVGKIWHVPSLPSINVEDLATRAASLANVTAPKVKPVSALMMGFIGLFVPVVKELREVRYQFDNPFQMSWAAYGEAFGAEATEFDAALQATIGWWQDELRAV